MSRSDGSLLRRIKDGEQDAATQLYVRYSQRLIALAKANTAKELTSRFDPEDIVQSVFRSFFRRASTGTYNVPEGGELWRLLLVLALNKVRRSAIRHRAKKRDASNTLSLHGFDSVEDELVKSDPTPLTILQMVIEDILQSMPESQRQMIELRIDGCTVEEIADSTGK
ncbi:MAG: sigma-70 family RNA polymerase sigma factor [Planctomycetales bacterium]|nr:sigma-70 family RNA polymerase sigma factor [Planctomycetales bacterium]